MHPTRTLERDRDHLGVVLQRQHVDERRDAAAADEEGELVGRAAGRRVRDAPHGLLADVVVGAVHEADDGVHDVALDCGQAAAWGGCSPTPLLPRLLARHSLTALIWSRVPAMMFEIVHAASFLTALRPCSSTDAT